MEEKHDSEVIGPFYTGPLHDTGIIAGMKDHLEDVSLQNPKKTEQLLEVYAGECSAPPFYLDLDLVSSSFKHSSPPRKWIIETLRSDGFFAKRTQFTPTGIKTDAQEKDVRRVYSEYRGRSDL